MGRAFGRESRLWFTHSHGILNEIYYPRVDEACIRDLGLIVTDGTDFFSEEKRAAASVVRYLAEGVPAYHLTNTCRRGRYLIEKEILSDPAREVLLQDTRFTALQGELTDLHLYALLAPHLGNRGAGNTAWVGDYKGTPMLFASREGRFLALACSAPWLARSVGFVGVSDGWQDLAAHRQLTWEYTRAENGNVALTGEVDLRACQGHFLLALGFGRTAAEAGNGALAALQDGFEPARRKYINQWQAWQNTLLPLDDQAPAQPGQNVYRVSTMVLHVHESIGFPGGIIASLSVPWGFNRGDDDLGGYHLVWPRDLIETAGGLLAAGGRADVSRVLAYLQSTQEADGHWPQNMWLDGTPYWSGIQMDATALPILHAHLARRSGNATDADLARFWPMLRKAAGFVVRNGPATLQDRWEENPGYTPFTIAAEIAALLVVADLADFNQEPQLACYLRETADAWNSCIEQWLYVRDTEWTRQFGVDGYYVRVAPCDVPVGTPLTESMVDVRNRPEGQSRRPAHLLISPDALALVRFGLRAPDDPRIVNTVKLIDAMLRVETPFGPAWHRYNDDGYGEQADGGPFDQTGIGRAWPLLTGERAHFELAAGRREEAERLMRSLEAFANDGGLLPEQIWDSPDIPARGLYQGRPSGSAMPLVWAHSEYLKLRRSLSEGCVFDLPPQTVRRYLKEGVVSPRVIWRFNHQIAALSPGKSLRIETLDPALIRWSADGGKTSEETETRDTGLGVHMTDLPAGKIPSGGQIQFTFYWPGAGRWEGKDFSVRVESL